MAPITVPVVLTPKRAEMNTQQETPMPATLRNPEPSTDNEEDIDENDNMGNGVIATGIKRILKWISPSRHSGKISFPLLRKAGKDYIYRIYERMFEQHPQKITLENAGSRLFMGRVNAIWDYIKDKSYYTNLTLSQFAHEVFDNDWEYVAEKKQIDIIRFGDF